jgi:HEAT repeat protein
MPEITDEAEEEEKSSISVDSINALVYALKDEYEGVRETSAYSLGLIGLPEGADAATGLIASLRDNSA